MTNITHNLCLSVFVAFKGTNISISFAITAAGVVPCDGAKKSPRTSSIVQIIFYFWFFEISGNILRIEKLVLCLEAYSRQHLAFRPHFRIETSLL